jgi:Domain of unknown function (DUF4281)
VLILSHITAFSPDSFSSLTNVKALFQNDDSVVAGWVHYLAFDLFVGWHIVDNLKNAGLPRWSLFVFLPLTLMFGPMGYLLFTVSKMIKKIL